MIGLNFHTGSLITGVNLLENLLFWTDDRNEPRRININSARQQTDGSYYSGDMDAAVIKAAPIKSPEFREIRTEGQSGVTNSTFLSDKLPRFAYRYQFEDGEYSVISPFTQIAYESGTDDIINSLGRFAEAGDFHELDNKVREVVLRVPDQVGIDRTTTTVEFLYKETTNSNIYILGEGAVQERNGVAGVEYTYRSQDPFRTLPADQLTRVYDAIPRRAKSQEIAGGRLVYGNYLQNYDLPASFDFQVNDNGAASTTQARHSVKRRRTYQVGVVLADRFGRTSPVLLSDSGNDTIFIGSDIDQGPKRLQIDFTTSAGVNTVFPEWAHSYRIVVKQREQEYYNVVLGAGTAAAGVVPANFPRSGDNVNKLPIDTTQIDNTGTGIRPSSAKVYLNFNGDSATGQTMDDTLYTPTGVLENGGIVFPGGQPDIQVPNNKLFETEPVTSDIDIFFETSTAGLVGDLATTPMVDIDFANCYIQPVRSTGAAATHFRMELNRIRAGFNEPFFDIGVRAHVVQENFSGEERRSATLIHSSGLFNSRTNVNQLNQFNESEGGLTINLDPSDGSIQKLFAEDTQLIIWQEDKVSRSPVDKDFIYSAEGGAVPVTSNTQFLGTIAPYAGEYGISLDPASFAVYGTRKYFTDKNRGVVLRLSQDGLQEISGAGMNDFFRDALKTSSVIIGSFNEYHDTYNLTIVGSGYPGNDDTNIATVRENARFNAENREAITAGTIQARDIDYFTISFEEDVKGWKSFSSFKQESGITLNNTYYTFSGGNLWEHSLNQTRNNFYGVQYSSLLELIFNDAPSVIKEFKTLATEGTAGWDCTNLDTDIESFGEDVEDLQSDTLTLNFVSATTFAGNTQIPVRSLGSVTEGQTTNFIVSFEPNDGYQFTDPSQIRMSVANDNFEDDFIIAAFDDAGEQTNAQLTEQEVIGGNIVSVIRHTAPAGLLSNDAVTINVDGVGPAREVVGDQFRITLNLTSITITGQAFETLDGDTGTNVISLDGQWFQHDGTTRDVTYGLQALKDIRSDGSINIRSLTNRYFPYEDGDLTYDTDSGVVISDVGTIDYSSNIRSHVVENSVSFADGSSNTVPTTFSFGDAPGGVPNRNDLFITQRFERPLTALSDTWSITNQTDLPAYPRLQFQLVSVPAVTGTGTTTMPQFLSGPVDGSTLRYERNITINGTPFMARQPRTGTLLPNADALHDPLIEAGQLVTPTTWTALPQTFDNGPVFTTGAAADPRADGGTLEVELATGDARYHITPPAADNQLPPNWRLTDDAPMGFWDGDWSFSFDNIKLVATRNFHAIDDDTTVNIMINGHAILPPPAGSFRILWGANNTTGTVDSVYNVMTNPQGVDTLTMNNHVVGDVALEINAFNAQHYYGLFAGRNLERQTPSATDLIDRENDIITVNNQNTREYARAVGTPPVRPFNMATGTNRNWLMPLGGPPRHSRFDRNDDTYDSSEWLFNSPNTTTGDPDATSVRATLGYGEYRFPADPADPTQGHAVWLRQTTENGNLVQNGVPLLGVQAQGFYEHDVDVVTAIIPYNPYPVPRSTLVHAINAQHNVFENIIGAESSSPGGPDTISITQPSVPKTNLPTEVAGVNFRGPDGADNNFASSDFRAQILSYADTDGVVRIRPGQTAGIPAYRELIEPGVAGNNFLGREGYIKRNFAFRVNGQDDGSAMAVNHFMPQLWHGLTYAEGTDHGGTRVGPGSTTAHTQGFGIQDIVDFSNVGATANQRAMPFPVRVEMEWTGQSRESLGAAVAIGTIAGATGFTGGDNRFAAFTNEGTPTGARINGITFQGTTTNGSLRLELDIPWFDTFGDSVVDFTFIDENGVRQTQGILGNPMNIQADFTVGTGDDSHSVVTWNDNVIADLFQVHHGGDVDAFDLRINYSARAETGIKLGRGNLAKFGTAGLDPRTATLDEYHRIVNDNEWFPNHGVFGIPRFRESTQGGHNLNDHVRQIVYFVPIIGDDFDANTPGSVRRPYSVPGADGMNYAQTVARISELTNGTFVQRYHGRGNPNFSFDGPGTRDIVIEAGSSNRDHTAPLYNVPNLPQLIVFVPAEDTGTGDFYTNVTSQLELWYDANGTTAAGSHVGHMHVNAFDFLDTYWTDNNGTPKFYPNPFALSNYTGLTSTPYYTFRGNQTPENVGGENCLALDMWGKLGYTFTAFQN